ncbi:MAG: pitrilysin family protein [Gemmatimonadota bacterium]
MQEITLSNGLRVLAVERPGAPTVSFVMQFRVGGVDEPVGSTGIAHVLEHMLFKGTETIGTMDLRAERQLFAEIDAVQDSILERSDDGPTSGGERERLEARRDSLEDAARTAVVPNEYTEILTRAGAQGLNAMTTNEATIYFVEMPAARAELFFALEGDRMANPVFREFYSERAVVMEERRMRVDTNPAGALFERHLATAFREHPYGQPVVGTMADLQALTRPEVEAYYRRFYGPSNAVLAVVGAIDPEDVARWSEEYLGAIPAGDRPPGVSTVEPEQREERRIHLTWEAEPLLRIGWHIPASTHPDGPAIALLASILTGGRTSRLHRRLVTEEGIATSVFASTGPGSLYAGLFQIDATPVAPATTAQLEASIYEEIERLARDGPTEAEIERIRNQVAAGSVRRMQSNLGLAFQLAESESLFGDWRETFRVAEDFLHIDAEAVRRVASEYLTATNRTVATLGREESGR